MARCSGTKEIVIIKTKTKTKLKHLKHLLGVVQVPYPWTILKWCNQGQITPILIPTIQFISFYLVGFGFLSPERCLLLNVASLHHNNIEDDIYVWLALDGGVGDGMVPSNLLKYFTIYQFYFQQQN